jgi:CheY-like chemotaxis protein
MHDGKVEVQSAGLNQGSTFRIELPLTAAARVVPETGTDTTSTPRSGRVLVVEDNSDGLRTLVELLEAHGYAVAGAVDGPEALRLAGELKPELVLLDLGLPGMNGYEVATYLRRDAALANMRIVALTGWGTQGDRAKTTAAGFDGHITKPVAPEELLQLVRNWLQP